MTTLIVLAVLAAALLGGGAYAVVRLRRLTSRWRRRLLGVREACRVPGPRRDAVRLRRRLYAELAATREMLEHTPDGLVFRADAGSVLAELAGLAVDLDRDLRGIERFGDEAHQRAALAEVEPQVRQLVETSYSARRTILQTATADRARALGDITQRMRTQAAALEAYERATRELSI